MTKLLVIDPGHGGSDPGAVGYGHHEADDVLSFGLTVGSKLTAAYKVNIAYTRNTDIYIGLNERADKSNALGADLFIAFHENAAAATSARGFESFIYSNAGSATKKVQGTIHKGIAAYMKSNGVVDRGQKKANFAVLRETVASAILFENLFISNGSDNGLQHNAAFKEGLANVYVAEIASVLGLPKKVVAAAPAAATQNIASGTWATVTASVLNVRSGASTSHSIIGTLKNGEKIKVGNHVSGWYNIYFGNHGGWVSDAYIK